MRVLIAFLLLCSVAYAEPFLKCDCADNTNYLIINESLTQFACPLSLDVEYLQVGVTDFVVIPMGQSIGEDFTFRIEKTDSKKTTTYNIKYDKADKVYFSTKETTIRVKK